MPSDPSFDGLNIKVEPKRGLVECDSCGYKSVDYESLFLGTHKYTGRRAEVCTQNCASNIDAATIILKSILE